MADTEEPQFTTLAERIAALNKQKNFNGAGTEVARKKPPPPPPSGRSGAEGRSQTAPVVSTNGSAHQITPQPPPRPSRTNTNNAPPPLPRRNTQASLDEAPKQEQSRPVPPLPSRTPSSQSSPALPPRRSATQLVPNPTVRRNSASSEASLQSAVSSLSLTRTTSSNTSHGSNGTGPRKLPPVCDLASLPPLPPTRRELEAKAKEAAAKEAAAREAAAREVASQPRVTRRTEPTPPSRPSLPPRLPSRPGNSQSAANTDIAGRTKSAVVSLKSTQIRGFNSKPPEQPPRMPARPKLERADDAPPPVPMASRPSMTQIQATSTRASAPAQIPDYCWICRDWSGPDDVAAQYPSGTLPRNDPIGHLAHGLCDPFPSYTDKARAIFTWFHHNIAYDTKSFFANDVKYQTPEQTIFSGWAVCQGYADAYKAIANRAGLECVVVGGHGKGFGYTPLKKGERPPPAKPDGHAWNAVRVDGGVWKLLDACWGAGHICGNNNLYKKEFTPTQFTTPNNRFGDRHFPIDPKHQFRDDGRVITWEEYYIGRTDGEPPVFYTNGGEEGVAEHSVGPAGRQIPVNSGQIVRFQFSKICQHWTSEKNGLGKPPLFLLEIHGVDGRKPDRVPIQTDGYWHWIDVHARDLGAPGQPIHVLQLTSFDGRDARGLSAEEYLSKKGRVAMGWSPMVTWDLV